MKLLFFAAVLANWSYDGFVADPAKPQPNAPQESAVAPASPAPKPEPAATTIKTPEPSPRTPSAEAKPAVAKPAIAKPATVRAAVAAPVRWRLADSTGQVWEHTDPDWLSRWVAERNAQVAYSAVYYTNAPAAPGSSWTCTPNGCYRTSQ